MDLSSFRALLTERGRASLASAAALGPTEATFLACLGGLQKQYPPELAKAALETTLLRLRARDKFAAADRMFFTREALEQATSEPVARHRAKRFAGIDRVADLCCGIGGDALALASTGVRVEAIDRDPLHAAMAETNAAALGFGDRVRCHAADALTLPLPDVNAAFADPARRADGRRHLNPEDYTPPLSALRGRFAPGFPLAVKAAPGVAHADIPADTEAEFVSLGGELKECVLWFGPLRTAARRATVLPTGDTLFGDSPRDSRPLADVGAYLFDPDPAVTRAGLVPGLADRLDARPIDWQVQLLTAERHTPTPFATAFAVEHVAPFHAGRLRDHLRANAVGRVTVIKRGSPADADAVVKQLKLAGPNYRTLFLTRVAGRHAAVVCERVGHSLRE